jgi:hypothetical protein
MDLHVIIRIFTSVFGTYRIKISVQKPSIMAETLNGLPQVLHEIVRIVYEKPPE